MDGVSNGKPYEQMDDLGGKTTIFGNTHIITGNFQEKSNKRTNLCVSALKNGPSTGFKSPQTSKSTQSGNPLFIDMDVENLQIAKWFWKVVLGLLEDQPVGSNMYKGSLTMSNSSLWRSDWKIWDEPNLRCVMTLPSTGGSFDAGAATEAGRLGSWAPWKSIVLFPPGKYRKLPSLKVT